MNCPACGVDNRADARFCDSCGAPLGGASGEHRKVVTVLFCDMVGSTALGESTDPEALRALLASYFERMRGIVERHGGSVEKFIGDAVMAVFGVPIVHEDDALRACRAATEMRDAFSGLGVEGRIGVSTGEVVTGTDERLATGDAVNVAARLEQAAAPGEVLIGEATLALVRDAVEVDPVEPLALKGKSEPVPAYRLLGAREAPERRHQTRFVGRERELGLLHEAWKRTKKPGCELVTIVGEAGVGKSRLAAETLASIEARVVRGRCLPYGEGITYWPVVEVVKQLDALPSDPAAAAAIRSLLGETDAATSAEEIAWAFRKLLEEAAPVAVFFDDIQWGEETFLDLIEHVGLLSSGSRILLLCMARPELLERRHSWPLTVRLEPLGDDEVGELIGERVPAGLRERIARAAGGNPLFISEMLAMADQAGAEVGVPPTLKALLATRLDQLDPAERRVLERGAVEGEIFHRGVVQALAPEETQVTPRLAALVRKEVIRPEKTQFAGEDGFRFRHLLVRDAAYDALPKSTRAELHERFAGWLQQRGEELVEFDEIVGHHLEQAHGFLSELGPPTERSRKVAAEGAKRLAAAGLRAYARSDMPAAASLLERAAALLTADDPLRVRLLPSLGRALVDRGKWEEARAVLSEAVQTGRAIGEVAAAADASVGLAYYRLHTDPHASHAEVRPDLDAAIEIFEEAHDAAGLARALTFAANLRHWRGEAAAAVEDFERAARYAHEAGDHAQEAESLRSKLQAALYGPTPVNSVLELTEDVRRRAKGSRRAEVMILAARAKLEAMQGGFGPARTLIAEARALAEELGLETLLASVVLRIEGDIELLAADPVAAEHVLRPACEALERMGDWAHFASVVPGFSDAVYAQGRTGEASRWLEVASRYQLMDDLDAQIGSRRSRAKLLAHDGSLLEAERLAREATTLAEGTDFLELHAKTLADLAEVLRLAGRPAEAAAALEEAIGLHDRKGNAVGAQNIRAALAELSAQPPVTTK